MWSITRYNPTTHDIEMQHAEGDVIKFVIPTEHTLSRDLKLAYMKAQSDAHILSIKVKEKLPILNKYKSIILTVLITAIITTILLKVLHGI